MKRRIKNSQTFSNVKSVADDGLIELKTGEVASLIEVKAIDLSLASKSEKNNFFYALKSLYQVRNLNLKCYKLAFNFFPCQLSLLINSLDIEFKTFLLFKLHQGSKSSALLASPVILCITIF